MSKKNRPIYDYYINGNRYHTNHNLRRFKMHPESINPFKRAEYRIVDCKIVSNQASKYIAFYVLLAYEQMKIIKGNVCDDTIELYKKIRKSLNANEPVCIRFDSLASVPFTSPAYGLGISIFTDGYSLADMSKENLSDSELEYYTAPFTKREWIYEAPKNEPLIEPDSYISEALKTIFNP